MIIISTKQDTNFWPFLDPPCDHLLDRQILYCEQEATGPEK